MPRMTFFICGGICLLAAIGINAQVLRRNPTMQQLIGYRLQVNLQWQAPNPAPITRILSSAALGRHAIMDWKNLPLSYRIPNPGFQQKGTGMHNGPVNDGGAICERSRNRYPEGVADPSKILAGTLMK